ncbi:hypothetical protein QJR52_06190 [Clostridium baratii]|uniref:hypothetical protein n=1 Tax=Clostridium baratii TaxID=1561 RepID=UPI0030D2537E
MIVKCDDCNESFEIDLKTEKVVGDIERTYFNCKHCNKKYISYYTNSKIKYNQERLRKILKKAEKCRDDNTYKKLEEQYNKLSLSIKKDMTRLKKKYEKSLK